MKKAYFTALLALPLALGACTDRSEPLLADGAATVPALDAVDQQVRSRAEESPRNSVHTSDERLWQLLDYGRGTALVGLKAPGRRRGVWRAQVLMTRSEHTTGRNAVRAMPGITLLGDLPPLPVVEVRISDADALARLRKLPFVDYVEPARMPRAVLDEAIGVHGPVSAFDSNCRAPEAYTDSYGTTSYGDAYSYSFGQYYRYHRISSAWNRTQGDNVRIALLDTGMDPQQTQFSTYFNPRPWEYSRAIDGDVGAGSSDPCGHGTRMAGVIAAPNDGRSVVGVAWKSDLRVISVASRGFSTNNLFYDYIISVDPYEVYWGLMEAMGDTRNVVTGGVDRIGTPSKIINMAFKTYNDPVANTYPNTVADLIRYYYYGPDGPLFIAAIGTVEPAGVPNAVFPSELDEVVAVVALNSDGSRNVKSNYGPKSEVAAYVPAASVSVPSYGGHQGITRVMGASGASGVITGIAALIWSRYPTWTNYQVRQRLRQSADHPSSHTWGEGYGFVDAYTAVGGFTGIQMEAKDCTTAQNPTIMAAVYPRGEGPFAFEWSNGSTEGSTVYSAAPVGDGVSVWVTVTDLVENRTMTDGKFVVTVDNTDPRFMECLMF